MDALAVEGEVDGWPFEDASAVEGDVIGWSFVNTSAVEDEGVSWSFVCDAVRYGDDTPGFLLRFWLFLFGWHFFHVFLTCTKTVIVLCHILTMSCRTHLYFS